MNRSVDPCEDFYQFACGNFKNVNKLAYNTHEYDVFKMVDDNIRVHTRGNIIYLLSYEYKICIKMRQLHCLYTN